MKSYYKYVFVILVYRNTEDLEYCILSIKRHIKSVKIIVVNAFYDKTSEEICRLIANQYSCDFISIENKGYSYGNNRGIRHALSNYDFKYLIIANPDTEIIHFDDSSLDNLNYDIFAPCIITLKNNKQNPMHIKHHRFAFKMLYHGFKKNIKSLIFASLIFTKIFRQIIIGLKKLHGIQNYQIYSAHGSFVILKKNAILKLNPIYDEKMFLFAEEGVLAIKAEKTGLKTCYLNNICVRHKEDGSMKLSNLSINSLLKEANIYYYEHYEQNNGNCHICSIY